MIKNEYYLLIKGEDEKRISEEEKKSLEDIMFSEPMTYFTKFRENTYHTRDLQIRTIKQNYL